MTPELNFAVGTGARGLPTDGAKENVCIGGQGDRSLRDLSRNEHFHRAWAVRGNAGHSHAQHEY